MYFQCSCFLQHTDQVCNGSSSYNRIIYQNNSFTLDCRFQDTKFQMHTGFTFFLGRLDESSSYVAVLVKSKAEMEFQMLLNIPWLPGCLTPVHQ